MEYIKLFDNFLNESNKSKLTFIKQPKKKDAKTDVYNVLNDDNLIGVIKWSSRMRGYAFLPVADCEVEIKEFVKTLMQKRRDDKKLL
jgi:hypothetical protein